MKEQTTARLPLLVSAGGSSEFAADGRIDWTVVLAPFLAALGFGGWDTASLGSFGSADVMGRPLVLLAFAPAECWSERAVEALELFAGPMLLEGPLPERAAARLLGVTAAPGFDQFKGTIANAGPITITSNDLLLSHLARGVDLDAPAPLSAFADRLIVHDAKLRPDPRLDALECQPPLAYLANTIRRLDSPSTFHVHPRPILQAVTLMLQGRLLFARRVPPPWWPDPPFEWSYRKTVALLGRLAHALTNREQRLEPTEIVRLIVSPPPSITMDTVDLAALDLLAFDVIEFLGVAIELDEFGGGSEREHYLQLLDSARILATPPAAAGGEGVPWALVGEADGGSGRRARLPATRLAALALWSKLTGSPVAIVTPPSTVVPAAVSADAALRIQELAVIASHEDGDGEPLRGAIAATADELMSVLRRPAALNSRFLASTVALTANAAALVGASDLAMGLLQHAATALCDSVSGLLRDESVRTSPEIGLALVSTLRVLLPDVSDPVPTSAAVIERWRRGMGPLQRWEPAVDGVEVIVEAWPEDATDAGLPFLVRRGPRLGLSFPLLTWMIAECCPPPPPPGKRYWRLTPAIEASALAVALVEALWLVAGRARPLVWPWPARIGVTLRHDVDRIPPRSTLEPILAGEGRHRQASTYCFIAGRFATPMRELLEYLGHEVAAHGEHIDRIAADLAQVRAWATTPVTGWTGHGTPQGTGSSGARAWLAAEAAGCSYADFTTKHSVPFPLPAIGLDEAEAVPRVLDIDLFDVDAGLDSYLDDGAPSGGAADDLDRLEHGCLRRRDHYCLNNHPDLGGIAHAQTVAQTVVRLGESAWFSTLGQVSRRRREVLSVEIRTLVDGSVELRAPRDVAGLQLVLAGPRGGVPCTIDRDGRPAARLALSSEPHVFALDIGAGNAVRVAWVEAGEADRVEPLSPTRPSPTHRAISEREIEERLRLGGIRLPSETAFGEFRPLLEEGVHGVWRRTGRAGVYADSGSVKKNVEYNGIWVPARARAVKEMVENAYGFSFEHRALLDLGCGFGGVGLWLLTQSGASSLHSCEIDADRLCVFENVVDELGIVGVTTDNVGFHQVRLPAESFDLAVFVDVFAYDSFDMSILSKVAAALRTAGIVIIKAANRWADRDAFTDIPGLNLLHRNTALSALDVLTGSHDVYANTRLMSPYDLVQLLEPRGFGDFRLQKDVPNSPYAGTIHTRFFYLAARRR